MTVDWIQPIEKKCSYCGKEAKNFWYRQGFFLVKLRWLCEEHRLLAAMKKLK